MHHGLVFHVLFSLHYVITCHSWLKITGFTQIWDLIEPDVLSLPRVQRRPLLRSDSTNWMPQPEFALFNAYFVVDMCWDVLRYCTFAEVWAGFSLWSRFGFVVDIPWHETCHVPSWGHLPKMQSQVWATGMRSSDVFFCRHSFTSFSFARFCPRHSVESSLHDAWRCLKHGMAWLDDRRPSPKTRVAVDLSMWLLADLQSWCKKSKCKICKACKFFQFSWGLSKMEFSLAQCFYMFSPSCPDVPESSSTLRFATPAAGSREWTLLRRRYIVQSHPLIENNDVELNCPRSPCRVLHM